MLREPSTNLARLLSILQIEFYIHSCDPNRKKQYQIQFQDKATKLKRQSFEEIFFWCFRY